MLKKIIIRLHKMSFTDLHLVANFSNINERVFLFIYYLTSKLLGFHEEPIPLLIANFIYTHIQSSLTK